MGDGLMDGMNDITWHRNNQTVLMDTQRTHTFHEHYRPDRTTKSGGL
ncbi:hypothetical protein [uncultured Methanospirillum sp.]|nr:hypothetical protein [uncultured Methanospirillum sp.]